VKSAASRHAKRNKKGRQQCGLTARYALCGLLSLLCCLWLLLAACRPRGALLEQAQEAWDREDYETAALLYEEFLKENPEHRQASEVRLKVANIYHFNLKQYERATQHYIHLIEDHPDAPQIPEARQRLAETFAAMGKRREAINEYEILLARAETPNRRRLRLNVAELYYEQEDFSQALAEYEKVVKEAPYDQLSERAYLRIGGILSARNEFEEAIPVYQLIIQQTDDAQIRRHAQLSLADCYERTFRYDQAIAILEKTEPDPQDPTYLARRIALIREQERERKLPENLASPGGPMAKKP
jgi:tetratricopeptide (TPR) repeat protein